MKKFFILFFLILLTIFQATFGWANIILIFLLFLVNFFSFNQFFWLVFLLGAFLDLLEGNLLGSSSLGFLLVLFLFWRYRQKFNFHQSLVLGVFVFLISLGWEKVFSGVFNFKNSLLLVILALVLNKLKKTFNLFPEDY